MGDRAGTLVDVLVARAEETPDRLAYDYLTGETLDYGELYRRAAMVAATVASASAPGDRVLLPSVFGPAFVTGFFGCLLAGRVPVPVAYSSSAAGTAAFAVLAADCAAAAVLAPAELHMDHGTLTRLVSDAPGHPIAEPVRPAADDIAFLQYTFGSTPSPRGVVVSYANLRHNLDAIAHVFGATPDHRGVFWLPAHHDMGLVGGLLAAVHTGCPVTLMSPTAFLRDPLDWLRTVAEHDRTVSGGPNFGYEHAVRKVSPADVAGLDLSGWEVAFVGAEVNPAVLDRFAEHFAPAGFRPESFLPCYGMAESTLLVSATRKGDGVRTAGGVVSRGRPVGTVAIVDEGGRRVRPGETGEIWVSGPSVARGYRRDGEPFDATLPGEPGTYLRTGDLGFERDGELYVTGRLKELVVLRGRNVVPQDIERTVETRHPQLRAGVCAAVGVTVAGEERLAVVLEADRRTKSPELAASVRHVVSREPRVAEPDVQLSLFCFARDPDETGKHALFLECARYADEHGFHAIWVPERNFPRFGGPFPTPAVLGAALATTTTRLRIRPGVLVPERDAVSTAQEWTVVDNLSGGRVDLAFAAEHQHELLAATRKIRHLWRGRPWLLCTGGTDRFAQAGAAGAHVVTALLLADIDKIGTKLAAYRNARAAHGHDAGHVTVVLDLFAATGSAELVAARVERLAAAGIDELACLVDLGSAREEVLAELRHLAELLPAPANTRPAADVSP